MVRKPPRGPHADVAERFAFLLEALELDRGGFVEAVDEAVTARSLFAILAGDRRPSRSLAVLIERTFGFRADHLLNGHGPMWTGPADRGDDPEAPAAGATAVTPAERRLLAFARSSVENARLLEAELARAEMWATGWGHASALLAELERLARSDDPEGYPAAAEAALEECWRMADSFRAWSDALDQRRALHLTQLFVRRFLVQVPGELCDRGALGASEAAQVGGDAEALLATLEADQAALASEAARIATRIRTAADATPAPDPPELAARLRLLVDRVDRHRPLPA